MGLVRTRISALQLQSILSWLLLFLLSPYSTIGALAKVSKCVMNLLCPCTLFSVQLRRDGETVVSSEPNSSNSTVKNDSNNKLKRALHGIVSNNSIYFTLARSSPHEPGPPDSSRAGDHRHHRCLP